MPRKGDMPRARIVRFMGAQGKKNAAAFPLRRFLFHRSERIGVFARFGGDLLSHILRCSTIGAVALNFRVREGTGCFAHAMTTKPSKNPIRLFLDRRRQSTLYVVLVKFTGCDAFVDLKRQGYLSVSGSNQAYRTISTGQLNALLRLHLRPIDVVVYHGPQGYLVLRGASRLDAFSGYPFRS